MSCYRAWARKQWPFLCLTQMSLNHAHGSVWFRAVPLGSAHIPVCRWRWQLAQNCHHVTPAAFSCLATPVCTAASAAQSRRLSTWATHADTKHKLASPDFGGPKPSHRHCWYSALCYLMCNKSHLHSLLPCVLSGDVTITCSATWDFATNAALYNRWIRVKPKSCSRFCLCT